MREKLKPNINPHLQIWNQDKQKRENEEYYFIPADMIKQTSLDKKESEKRYTTLLKSSKKAAVEIVHLEELTYLHSILGF